MKEDFLHYVWRFLKFNTQNLSSTAGKELIIFHNGTYQKLSGPDFFNAKIQIDGQIWAGNVEIHIKASDWYTHKHQNDQNYQNVILHVVWEDDVPVVDRNGIPIPTLELKDRVSEDLVNFYKKSFLDERVLKCENLLHQIDTNKISIYQNTWLIEKLDEKANEIHLLLEKNNGYWEEVFCNKLFRNFGTKQNGENFEKLISGVSYALIQKLQSNPFSLEALLYGSANMLPLDTLDDFTRKLTNEYAYLKHKYSLETPFLSVEYFKLRPDNFPTIRISQFVQLVSKHQSLFFELINIKEINEFYSFFNFSACAYWDTHYVFNKSTSKVSKKKISKSFINLLLINTVLPFKYAYFKDKDDEIVEDVICLYEQLLFEDNSVTQIYPKQFFLKENALHSQSLLYLNKEYCSKKKCLNCSIGSALLYNL